MESQHYQREAIKVKERLLRQKISIKKYHQSARGKQKLAQAQKRYYLKKKGLKLRI